VSGFSIKRSKNDYNSNRVFKVSEDGYVEQAGETILTTGAVSPLNLKLKAPLEGGFCTIKLGDDGGQNAILTLEGCVMEDGSTTVTFTDIKDEVKLNFYEKGVWILTNSKGSVVVA